MTSIIMPLATYDFTMHEPRPVPKPSACQAAAASCTAGFRVRFLATLRSTPLRNCGLPWAAVDSASFKMEIACIQGKAHHAVHVSAIATALHMGSCKIGQRHATSMLAPTITQSGGSVWLGGRPFDHHHPVQSVMPQWGCIGCASDLLDTSKDQCVSLAVQFHLHMAHCPSFL